MPYTLRFCDSNKFAFIRITGKSSTAELIGLFDSLVERRGPLAGARVFCDVSAAVGHVMSWKVMIDAVQHLRAKKEEFAEMRWANYAASSVLNYGVSRMAGEMAIDLPFEYQAFNNLELALNWLAVPAALRPLLTTPEQLTAAN